MAFQSRLLDNYFKITERGSTVGSEVRGGVVTFVAMAYIVVLNPLILGSFSASDAAAKTDVLGNILPVSQVAAVTALVAGFMSILFGIVANYPFGIAAGLGINTLLAVTIAPQQTLDGAKDEFLIVNQQKGGSGLFHGADHGIGFFTARKRL